MADKTRQSARHQLSVTQRNAIDMIVAGRNDRETSELVGVSRQTVTSWRLYDLEFRAALNQTRTEVWSAAADRLRALIPQALEELEGAFGGPDGVKAAIAVLRIAGGQLSGRLAYVGPTNPEDLLREEAESRHGLLASLRRDPGEFALELTRRELEGRANALLEEASLIAGASDETGGV